MMGFNLFTKIIFAVKNALFHQNNLRDALIKKKV
jgi:hypothetical protein